MDPTRMGAHVIVASTPIDRKGISRMPQDVNHESLLVGTVVQEYNVLPVTYIYAVLTFFFEIYTLQRRHSQHARTLTPMTTCT
jgi:hypothetical protein